MIIDLIPERWDFSFYLTGKAERYDARVIDMSILSKPLVTIIIPAFNEGDGLAQRLDTLSEFVRLDTKHEFEIIVVDDGSSDETYAIAQNAARTSRMLRVLQHKENRGMGAAIRTGFTAARGSVFITYDSDLSYRPEVISDLLEEMDATQADLVLASPYMRGGSVRNVPWLRRLLSREANRFLSFAANGKYATITCMVRAYRAAFIRNVHTFEDRMEINAELLFKAIRQQATISEIPALLEWSADRSRTRARINISRTTRQIWRTLRFGVAHRPAVLLALPGILPGVLPLLVATLAILHVDLRTAAAITLITVIIQNASLALFAGQIAMFGRNVTRHTRSADNR